MNNEEYVDFGILGKYQKNNIVLEDDEIQTKEEENIEIKNILEKYNSNFNIINGKILYKLFDEFVGVEPYIWELNKEQFNNILNAKELPSNFEQMSNLEKCNLIFNGEYGKKYVEDDYMKIFNERFPYFDYDRFVDNFYITNVNINNKFGIINIEFRDKTTLFNALMVINYNKDFDIVQFSNG